MTEIIPFENYLDDRNIQLFQQVQQAFKIELHRILNSDGILDPSIWQLNCQGDTIKISYYRDPKNNASFTHELLHAGLLKNGYTDTSVFLLDHLQQDSTTELLFCPIIAHIQNIYAHPKMLRTFETMGYPIDEFTCDYHRCPDIKKMVGQNNDTFCKQELPNESIQSYVTSFYTMKDNRNPANGNAFDKLDAQLQITEPRLYNILNDNWNNWLANENPYNNKPFIEQLLTSVTNWYKERKS